MAQPSAPAPWRSRIVGHGEEAPDQLLANPLNWRIHPLAQQRVMGGILDELGWLDEVVVNQRSGFVLNGHMRVALALSSGQPTVPVRYVDLSPEEEAKALATFDPVGDLHTRDQAQLDTLLAEVRASEPYLVQFLAGLSPSHPPTPTSEEAPLDRATELQAKWQTAPDQLWLIPSRATPGSVHRLLCGDSANPAHVARLMDGARAELLMTDPPYGVDYAEIVDGRANQKRGGWASMTNDSATPDLDTLLTAAFANAIPALAPDAPWFCWTPSLGERALFRAALEAAGVHIGKEIVWIKPHFVFGRWEYHWQHESCLYGWRPTGGHPPFFGDRAESTVWAVDHDGGRMVRNGPTQLEGLGDHPTQKPVELWARAIRNHLPLGHAILDLFAGAGPALLAAEQTARTAFAIDIDPGYIAVILERLTTLGLAPALAD